RDQGQTMSAINTIQNVLGTRLLLPDLTIVPARGAMQNEIQEEEARLGRALCPDHRLLLQHWNGIALEVIRFFGCGDAAGEIGRLAEFQINADIGEVGSIVVASDASGFVYLQANDERVFSLDTDGGNCRRLADSLDDFIDRV